MIRTAAAPLDTSESRECERRQCSLAGRTGIPVDDVVQAGAVRVQ